MLEINDNRISRENSEQSVTNITPRENSEQSVTNITPRENSEQSVTNITPRENSEQSVTNITPRENSEQSVTNITPRNNFFTKNTLNYLGLAVGIYLMGSGVYASSLDKKINKPVTPEQTISQLNAEKITGLEQTISQINAKVRKLNSKVGSLEDNMPKTDILPFDLSKPFIIYTDSDNGLLAYNPKNPTEIYLKKDDTVDFQSLKEFQKSHKNLKRGQNLVELHKTGGQTFMVDYANKIVVPVDSVKVEDFYNTLRDHPIKKSNPDYDDYNNFSLRLKDCLTK